MTIPTKAKAGSVPSATGYYTAPRQRGSNYKPKAGQGRTTEFTKGIPPTSSVRNPETSMPPKTKAIPTGQRDVHPARY